MTQHRFDLLPLAKPLRIGLPYHGLVDEGVLTLPNESEIEYEDPSGGQAIVVRHPAASVPSRSQAEIAYDEAAGYQWLDYALLSGVQRQIAGHDLGQYYWLYCDANTTWIVSLQFDKVSSIDQRAIITLHSNFGTLCDANLAMTPRQLASYTWTPKRENGTNQTTADAALARVIGLTHSETGAVSVLNVAAYGSGMPWHGIMGDSYVGQTYGFHDAIKITISGNGSVTAGTVGEGISASISHLATAPDMYATTGVVYSDFACPEITQCPQTSAITTNWEICHVAMPDGTTSAIAYDYSSTTTFAYSAPDCESASCGNYDYAIAATWTVTFGPHTITGTNTEEGYWDGSQHVTASSSDGIPSFYRVHDNAICVYVSVQDTKTIYSVYDLSEDASGASDTPDLENTAIEPEQGIIRYTPTAIAGCYV